MPRFCITALIVLSCSTLLYASPGGTYDSWVHHRDALARDPSIVRCYTFDDMTGSSMQTANLASDKNAALTFRCDATPSAKPLVISGRWPGKKAVRLDEGFFAGPVCNVFNRAFTVETWFRKNGPGTLHGNAGSSNGTILSVGIGYWDGWRLTTSYPERTIAFEIGRPQPSSAYMVMAAPLSDSTWHHLAATWDGKEMRIYFDGIRASSGQYAGAYTPPVPGAEFRIGYAGYGVGSAKLDFDEVIVRNRALSADEVLQNACFYSRLPQALWAHLRSADRLIASGDLKSAASECAPILSTRDVHPDLKAVAHLMLARISRAQSRPDAAISEYGKIIDIQGACSAYQSEALTGLLETTGQAGTDGVPRSIYEKALRLDGLSLSDRTRIRLCLARSLRQEGRCASAISGYREILKQTGIPSGERLDIRLELAHTYMAAKDYPSARKAYSQILRLPSTPAYTKALAQLRIAETYARAKDYRNARAEFDRVAGIPNVPKHLIGEAKERVREITRAQAGLPPRDPSWNRVALRKQPIPAVEFFVAANGDDRNPGTKGHPFATLNRARDAIRSLRANGDLPKGGVVVYLRSGEYRVTQPLSLSSVDSGTEAAPVVYRAYRGESVRLNAGARVGRFTPVTDEAVLARIPQSARGRIMQSDLRAQGITDYGRLYERGFAHGMRPALELFVDGKPMQPARWPNTGFARVGQVIRSGVPGEGSGAIFEYGGDRPSRWTTATDAWLYGYWFFDWADTAVAVSSVDPQTHRISVAQSSPYGTRSGQRYYAFNLIEELDSPGEWYIDRAAGILYLYPPSDLSKSTVEVSMLESPVIEMDGASFVTIGGLTMEEGRGNGISIKGGSDCLIAGCTIRRFGGDGVVIDGGTHHGVFGCDIYTTGRGGTVVTGGDRKTLTPGRHFVENCHIYDFSRIDRTYTPAVLMNGVGNRIAHNLFHDSPHHAIRLEGNDHIVELNDIHSVVYESDDQAGLDIFQNPTYRGNIIRYNFWHHIGSGLDTNGQAGIRLDDAISGVLIYGNVFYKCSGGGFGAVQIHGGKENVVDNNIMIDCKYGISYSRWGEQRWNELMTTGAGRLLYEEVSPSKPPYSTRYPELQHVLENPDVNMAWRNLICNTREFQTRDGGVELLADNYVTSSNPGFVDAAHWNFALKSGSVVFDRTAFRPIPFNEIGLYKHPLRATWPVTSQITKHYQATP